MNLAPKYCWRRSKRCENEDLPRMSVVFQRFAAVACGWWGAGVKVALSGVGHIGAAENAERRRFFGSTRQPRVRISDARERNGANSRKNPRASRAIEARRLRRVAVRDASPSLNAGEDHADKNSMPALCR